MKHLGDITKLSGYDIPPVDVITGGSPCQDLSVAGKREGLSGARSGLFKEQIRIIKEMREATNGEKPRFMVWENVVGAFSSNKGEDFRTVLEETARIADKDAVIPRPPKGKWSHAGCIVGVGDNGQPFSVAYRVHDAQFWGVPQRRRRIALVADFGGTNAPDILFDEISSQCEGLHGNPATCGEERERTAADIEGSVAATITASYGTKWNGNAGAYNGGNFVIEAVAGGCLKPLDAQTERIYGVDGPMETLPTNGGKSGMNRQAVFDVRISSDGTKNWRAHCYETDICRSLDTGGENPDSNHGEVAIVCMNDQGGECMGISEDVSGTLRAQEHGHQPIVFELVAASMVDGHVREDGVTETIRANAGDNRQAVVYGICSYDSNAMKSKNPNSGIYEADTARTLDLNGGSPACNQGGMAVVCATTEIVCLEGNGSRPSHQGDGWHEGDPMYTLNATEHHAVCCDGYTAPTITDGHENCVTDYTALCVGNGQANQSIGRVVNTISSRDYKGGQCVMTYQERTGNLDGCISKGVNNQNADNDMLVSNGYIVRRLTPLEEERLQGFPDGWTDIGDWTDSKGKKRKGDADTPRYKALGNSIALPFWDWMAGRMAAHLGGGASMGSLFDGIGGFPLVYMRHGVTPVWASEIEDFCIAVTRKRFG